MILLKAGDRVQVIHPQSRLCGQVGTVDRIGGQIIYVKFKNIDISYEPDIIIGFYETALQKVNEGEKLPIDRPGMPLAEKVCINPEAMKVIARNLRGKF